MASRAGDSGRKLGRYNLVEPIGGGPTGETFRGKVYGVAGFERQFAVKRFHPELVKDKRVADAIARAARTYAGLEHPRIARMQEFGVASGETFAATEMVEGVDLSRLLGATYGVGSAIAPGSALTIVLHAARAVGYAHGRGINHLGLCPTNVICAPDGDLKVTDFGFLPPRLPRRPADDFTLVARMPYLAPEQLVGEESSAASDVFQLGVVLYELLTGDKPFTGPTPLEISQATLAANPPPPSVPKPVGKVLSRALARSPFARYPDASALADGIEAALRQVTLPGGARDVGGLVRQAIETIKSTSGQPISGAFAFPLPAPPSSGSPLSRALERGTAPPPVPPDAGRRTVMGVAVQVPVPPPRPRPGMPAMPRPPVDEDATTNVAPSPPRPSPASGRGRSGKKVDQNGAGARRLAADDRRLGTASTVAMPSQPIRPKATRGEDALDLDDFPPTPLPDVLPESSDGETGTDLLAAETRRIERMELTAELPEGVPDDEDHERETRRVSKLERQQMAQASGPPPVRPEPPHVHGSPPPVADIPSMNLPVAEVAASAPRRRPHPAVWGALMLLVAAGGGYAAYQLVLSDDGAAAPATARPPVQAKRQLPKRGGGETAAPAAVTDAPAAPAAAVETSARDAAPPPAADLVITSQPRGAKIYIDGTVVGKTPHTLEATDDTHRLALVLPGYKLHTADIEGSGDIGVALEEVSPPEGRAGIKVRCKKKNRYYVILDGKDTGQLCPTERLGVAMGEHVVEIYDPITDSRRSFNASVEETRLSKRVRVD